MTASTTGQLGQRRRAALLPVAVIRPNPANPRAQLRDIDGLAASIAEYGIVQPLVVEHAGPDGRWPLVAGHRRLAAARQLRLTHVPAVVRYRDDRGDTLLLALVENLQRDALNPIEEAHAYQQLQQARGMTAAAVAAAIGVQPARVSARLQLLLLDQAEQDRVASGERPVTHAVEIVRTARRQTRAGRAPSARTFTPRWFGPDHLLAGRARNLCDTRAHPRVGRLGATACGQCWEQVIRDDQDRNGTPPTPPSVTS